MDNPSLRKSLHLLVHPLTVGALGFLLINDHILRRIGPGWWTGKLGDVAWLFFAPIACAAIVSLLLPRRRQGSTHPAALIAFTLVGAVFALAKTYAPAHEFVVLWAERLFGFSVGWRRDPTDLLALPALAASAALWARIRLPARSPQLPREAGWVALSLAALLTVANSPAPEPGIYCVAAMEGKVYAFAAYSGYESTDGGLTWAASDQPQLDCPSPWEPAAASEMVGAEPGSHVTYRITRGERIELSGDGGAIWRPGYDVAELSETERVVIERRANGNVSVRPAPLDAVIDPATGNAVFALGHNGVLVHGGGQWQSVGVGTFLPPAPLSALDVAALLLGEMLLGLAAGLLTFVTLVAVADRRRRGWQPFLLAAGWLLWAGIVFVLGPARMTGYAAAMSYLAMLGLGLLVLVLLVVAIIRLTAGVKLAGWRSAGVSALAALLFVLPYALWASAALPEYLMAAGFATVFVVATLFFGSRWAVRREPDETGSAAPPSG